MNELDMLLDEISSFNAEPPSKVQHTVAEQAPLTEEDLHAYMLKRASTLVDLSLNAVEELKPYVMQGTNPEEIAALAEVMNASSRAMENLNKLLLQKKKFENDVKLKHVDFEFKKEIALMEPKAQTINNNVYIASREEIFKKYINNTRGDAVEELIENATGDKTERQIEE